ncbi:MAG: sigma-54-dependent Fis family transcriptional regulator [Nitrospira sp.]|nr:sigma-54-dependent Fis family transcriptional regulator [Nitrospira sp.]
MAGPVVLVVDDEEGIRETLSGIFEDEEWDVLTSSSGEEAIELTKEQNPDLVFLDIWLPGMDGVQTLEEIKTLKPDLPVIMISGHGTIDLAVKATRVGAYDFLEKPLSLERVLLVARRALEKRTLEMEYRALKQDLTRRYQLVGSSQKMVLLKSQIEMAAQSNSRVLIVGESGSGKEIVARMLHESSKRAEKPFIEVNCAAIPQELIESELFGHEKGSFTGAFEKKKGKFELADGGTLFLDEVGDMSLSAQAKVLRVIETQEFHRVGGSKNIKVDVRIITATNKDLKEEAKKGSFREDLLYRLDVIPLQIPPLRERKEDIPELVEYFLEYFASEYGKKPKKITPEALKVLGSYEWPGNIRELRNVIERLVIMSPSDSIAAKNLVLAETTGDGYLSCKTFREARDAFEKAFIIRRLEENNWNISRTAEALQIERSNLHKKIKAYDIKVP